MDREEKLACLRLIRTPNIGPMTFSLLLQRYGSAIEALRAVPELAKRGGRSLKPAGRALAEAELQANEDAGASLLFKGAGDYPARLAQFDDAPPVLSVRGRRICCHGHRSESSARETPRSTHSGWHNRLPRTLRLKAMSSYRALPAGLMPRRITARWPAEQWR